MQGKQLRIGVGCVMCVLSTSVFAALPAPSGWYLEGNVGATHLSGKSYPGNASSSGLGGNANFGYKFIPYFATEIGYTRYKNTTIDDALGRKAGTDRHYSYDIAAKGILPVWTTGIELFAKVGAGRVASSLSINNDLAAFNLGLASSSHSKTGLYAGGGVAYNVTPEFAGVVQWARAFGNSGTGTMDLISVGISFIAD